MKAQPPRVLPYVLRRVLPPAVLFLAAIWLGVTLMAQRAVQTELDQRLWQQAAHAASALSHRLETLREATRGVAANDLLVNGLVDLERRAEYLPVFFRSLRIPGPKGARISMTDYRGRIVVSNGSTNSFEGSPWLRQIMSGREVFEISKAGLRVAAPVIYSGRPEGVIVVEYDAERVPDILRLVDSAAAFVVQDATGYILHSSNSGFARTGEGGLDESADGWMHARAPVPGFPQLSVLSAEPTTSALASVHRLDGFMLVAVVLDLAALIAGIVWTGLLVTRPLSRFVSRVRRFESPENLKQRIEPFGPAEIQELVVASNAANEKLEREIAGRRQAQEQVTQAVENMSEGFVIYGSDDRLVLCNSRNREIYSDSADLFVVGAHIEDILRASVERGQYDDAVENTEDWIAGRLDRFRNPRRVFVEKLSNGTWVQIHERKTEDGRTIGVRTDITELKAGEKALKLLEQTAVAANEASTPEDAMQICLDLVCAYTGWPIGHAYRLAGNSTEELVPSTLWHLKQPERFAPFRQMVMANRLKSGEGLAGRVLASEAPVWITDVTKEPDFPWSAPAEETGIRAGFAFPVLIGTDVTAILEFFSEQAMEPDDRLLELAVHIGTQLGRVIERKRAEEKRAKLERELLQAQKMKSLGTLAGGIAHEINTPIQYVSDNIRFLSDSFDDIGTAINDLIEPDNQTDGAIRKALEEIDWQFLSTEIPNAIKEAGDGTEAVSKIVRSVKEFSHPDAKEKSAVVLQEVIENTLTVSRNQWKYAAEVSCEFDGTLPQVLCFPGELAQVLINLVVNAAQAIEEVSDGKQGEIKIVTSENSGSAEIRVSDNGPGIPTDKIDRIFDLFFTTKAPGSGTGQGLSICKSIIETKHGGKLSVESEVGKGATFVIKLPFEPVQTERPAAAIA